jgi:predicted KAP-like P-loop ATPase
MQISFSQNYLTQTANNFNTSTSQNSDDFLKKALMQVPADNIPKILEKTKIPADENEIKDILYSINKGFEIYA